MKLWENLKVLLIVYPTWPPGEGRVWGREVKGRGKEVKKQKTDPPRISAWEWAWNPEQDVDISYWTAPSPPPSSPWRYSQTHAVATQKCTHPHNKKIAVAAANSPSTKSQVLEIDTYSFRPLLDNAHGDRPLKYTVVVVVVSSRSLHFGPEQQCKYACARACCQRPQLGFRA